MQAKHHVARRLFVATIMSLLVSGFSVAQVDDKSPLNINATYPEMVSQTALLPLSGSIESAQTSSLSALESGMVSELHVEIGDHVKRGDALLTLDSQLASLQLNSAQAEHKSALVNFAEATRLHEEVMALSQSQIVAQTLIAERAAAVSSAKAVVERTLAEVRLQQEIVNRHLVIAPFDGVITMRNVDIGEWITPQNSILELVDDNKLRLRLAIPQEYYSSLSTGADVSKVAVRIIPDSGVLPFTAMLTRIVPSSNTVSRAFTALIDIPSHSGLISGMSATGEISLSTQQTHKHILPRSALKRHPDGGSSVFRVENNKAVRVVTEVDILPDNKIAISSKVTSALYVISGIELLTDGVPVNVTIVESN